jgi:Zn-dependent protease
MRKTGEVQRSVVRPSPLFLALLALTIAGGVLLALQSPFPVEKFGDQYLLTGLDHQPLGTLGMVLLVLAGWAVSLTLHEFGHAMVAYRGGDHEVAAKGYLTLDIRRYTDPVFSIVIPVLLLLVGGIPLPGGAVWINRWALRSRATSSWVSLAGPLSNLVLGVLLAVVATLVPMPFGLVVGLSYLALLQILAFLLNILPVPGLDGYGAIEPYLPPGAREFGAKARPWAPLILFALLISVPTVSEVFFSIADALFSVVGGQSQFAAVGHRAFLFWR